MLSYALFSKRFGPYLSLAFAAIAVFAIYFTYTRTCLIIAAALVTYSFFRILRIPAAIAALICLASYMLLAVSAPNEIPNPFTAASEDTRFTGRSISYKEASHQWAAHPVRLLTGFGVGSAGSAQGDLFEAAAHIEPHNIFLKYLFEMGVPLGLTFIILLGWLFVSAMRAARPQGERTFVLALSLITVVAGLTFTIVEAWPANVYIFLAVGMFLPRHTQGTKQARVYPRV
ncbi:O-antigen ligase [Sphingomonas mucosissima]|uniref:O-antigen ligase n=1 Tax=Sphingomonas mucosissima TaxID=370959 RepID=A0A245ZDF1_9SPHN|nr:O-antigen ligase [Sphingomonas mucosissima]